MSDYNYESDLLKKYRQQKDFAEDQMRDAEREIDRLKAKHKYFLLREICTDLKSTGFFSIEQLKEKAAQFKNEELPDADRPFNHEGDQIFGILAFISWLDKQ